MNSYVFLAVVLLITTCICESDIYVKHLAGPPSEFPLFALPDPSDAADVQHSASFKVHLIPSVFKPGELHQIVPLLVDSNTQFQMAFFSPFSASLTLTLLNPRGHRVPLTGTPSFFPIGDIHVPCQIYAFNNPIQGEYSLIIRTVSLSNSTYFDITHNSVADAYVVLWNDQALAAHTFLNTYSLTTGNKIGLVTRAFDSSLVTTAGKSPASIGGVTHAQMSVELPNGVTINEPMHDDGLHEDNEATDGVYGGLITATVSGQYSFTAIIEGVTANGVHYVRTTQQVVSVVDPTLSFLGVAVATLASPTRADIRILVKAPYGTKYKVYAEVWGTDENGNDLAVAWIGGMAFTEQKFIDVELDLNWVSMSGAREPFCLRNVVVQDTQNFIPIAQANMIPIELAFELDSVLSNHTLVNQGGQITEVMREGVRPPTFAHDIDTNVQVGILMIHGYCSGANPWSAFPGDWSDAFYYQDFNKNVPHDTFATNVYRWAQAKGISAYTLVGHSQGGAIALHLLNYYWTGMDRVYGGRILQSVGTPYQGCSGAGSAADLGKLFGVTCGANTDLTTDGSSLWLNGITQQTRGKMNYYTTTYALNQLFGDYCNLAVNMLLKFPNDGTTELTLAGLPSGQNQGNTERWCHIGGMKYPPQCQNRARNVEMNKLAARSVL